MHRKQSITKPLWFSWGQDKVHTMLHGMESSSAAARAKQHRYDRNRYMIKGQPEYSSWRRFCGLKEGTADVALPRLAPSYKQLISPNRHSEPLPEHLGITRAILPHSLMRCNRNLSFHSCRTPHPSLESKHRDMVQLLSSASLRSHTLGIT